MANLTGEVLRTTMAAHDDRQYGAPIAAVVRLELLADRMLLGGYSYDDAEAVVAAAEAQLAADYSELESL